MASGATVKLGVEGISQFKSNMNQAKQAVKTLDAQLSLSEKQFKQTGDAESYMTEKTELLKAKLEQQKAVVNNAQKALDDMASRGVDRASKAYQDMYRQMITAKGALIDTENQLNGVAESGDKAADGVSEMNAQLKRVGDGVNFQQVTTGLGKITDGLEKAANKAINLAKKIAGAMIEAGGWADDLQTRAANYGMSPEQLQRMEKTSLLIDTSVDAIVNAQKKLKKGLGKEDKEVLGSFVELLGEGYDPRSRGWENAFWDAGEALMRFADEEEKEVYAQRLFGRSWAELIPLFQAGREEYEKTNESWKVVSQESIDKLQKMQDEYDKLMADWDTFKYEALSQFAEPMEQAFTAAQSALGKFMDYLKSEEGQKLVDNVVNGLKKAIEWISDPANIQKAIDGLKALIVGWGALKLVGGGLQVLNLVNGAKNLFGGGSDKVTSSGEDKIAASGSGLLTGTAAGAKLASFMSGAQIFSSVNGGPIMDWVMNNSPWATMFNGTESVSQWWNRMVGEQQARTATFADNWDPNNPNANVIAKTVGKIGQYNQVASDWTYGDEYSAEELMAMVKATEDLTGASNAQKQSSTEMSEAATTMKGLPGVIEGAILAGMGKIKVYIDGQQAGGVLTPYVNSALYGMVTGIIKP